MFFEEGDKLCGVLERERWVLDETKIKPKVTQESYVPPKQPLINEPTHRFSSLCFLRKEINFVVSSRGSWELDKSKIKPKVTQESYNHPKQPTHRWTNLPLHQFVVLRKEINLVVSLRGSWVLDKPKLKPKLIQEGYNSSNQPLINESTHHFISLLFSGRR